MLKTIRPNQSVMLNIDLRMLGQTSTKNRPYMVIAVNGQMTWLAPLTTVLKGKHGRVQVNNHQHRDQSVLNVEVVTTDMFSIATEYVKTNGVNHGFIEDGREVRRQIAFSVHSGTLGRYING